MKSDLINTENPREDSKKKEQPPNPDNWQPWNDINQEEQIFQKEEGGLRKILIPFHWDWDLWLQKKFKRIFGKD